MGGLSRRAYLIHQIKKETAKPVVLLDGGSLFFPEPVIADALLQAKKVQAAGIARAMEKMDYDAIGIAPQDLAGGLVFLQKLAGEFSLPLVSANLIGPGAGKPLFPPFQIKKAGKTVIGIIGLTGEEIPGQNPMQEEGYHIQNWQDILPETLETVRQKADMVILLSSYPDEINQQIADRFAEIHLIIQSGNLSANQLPRLDNNTVLTRIGSKGKYLGRMDISWNDSHRWQQDMPPRLKRARDMLDRINWRLGRLEKQPQGREAEKQQLLGERNKIIEQIKEIEKQIKQGPQNPSSFSNSFIPLKVSLPEDPEISEIVLQTKKDVNAAGKKRLVTPEQNNGSPGKAPGPDMVGWKTCQGCHPVQADFWLQTGHARAWQTLEEVQQEFNQDCLICHVTLPTYDAKTVQTKELLTNLATEYRGVGCETCHGPGRLHAENPNQHKPMRPDINICIVCHTPDQDPGFNFDRKVKLIRCPPDRK